MGKKGEEEQEKVKLGSSVIVATGGDQRWPKGTEEGKEENTKVARGEGGGG